MSKDKTAAGEKAPKDHPPGAAESGSGGSEESREGKSNQSTDRSGTGKGAKNSESVPGEPEEDDSARLERINKTHLKDAHKVLKDAAEELKSIKSSDSDESKVDGRRVMATGGFFRSVNGFIHSILERVAAAAHVVFTKENIPTLRAIITAMPGESALESFLLLALDQYDRTLPADPNADLTVEALNK
jgi:hypothetical protein